MSSHSYWRTALSTTCSATFGTKTPLSTASTLLNNKPNRNEFEGEHYPQASGAARVVVLDPKHEYEHVLRQISKNDNSGFVRDFAEAFPHAKEKWREVMLYHAAGSLAALH